MSPSVEQVKRLLSFEASHLEQEVAALEGALATARGEVGRIERLIRESNQRISEIKKLIAEAPR